MSAPAFVCLSPKKWVLGNSISKGVRRKLLRSPPPFDEIVAGLRDAVSIKSIRTERPRSKNGTGSLAMRVVVILEVLQRKHLVDLFHNSAAGIRAQCLHSVELGDVALNHARDALRCRALELAAERRTGPISMGVIRESLGLGSAKVWVHQGQWLRHARMVDRDLEIAGWKAHEKSECKKIRNLVRYGSKAPEQLCAVDLIGGWLNPSNELALKGKGPGVRSRQIHTYGFT